MPEALLRGVRLDYALRDFGAHWSGNAGTMLDYGFSERVTRLDDFISHDWRSSSITTTTTTGGVTTTTPTTTTTMTPNNGDKGDRRGGNTERSA